MKAQSLGTLCITLASLWRPDRDGLQGVFLQPIAWLLARKTTPQTARVRLITGRRESCRGSLGAWAAETASAANCPQQSIFRRFLGKYPDIRRRNRQKLSSLGPIFASTRSAAQAPSAPLKHSRFAELLVHIGAVRLGDFAAHRQVAEGWRQPEFHLVVIFAARFSGQFERWHVAGGQTDGL